MKMQILGTNTPAPVSLPTNDGRYARNAAKRYVRPGPLLIESHDMKNKRISIFGGWIPDVLS